MSDVRIRWTLDVVDRGVGQKLLRQDRSLRTSIQQTDKAYTKLGTTTTSVTARQVTAATRAKAATEGLSRASLTATTRTDGLTRAQQTNLAIGQRVVAQSDAIAAAYRRRGAAAESASIKERAASKIQGGIGRVGGGIDKVGGVAAGAAGAALRGGAIGGAVVGAAAITTGIKLGSDYNKVIDAQNVGFTTLLKSQQKAAAFMAQIQKLAIDSPVLDVRTTGDAARTLLAYGISLKRTLPLTKALGDASAASGKNIQEVLPQAALALGQIASKGKLQAQEMNQLAQSVGLSRGRIRKALGLTAAEFEDTFKPGANIKASKALPAILKALTDQSAGAADRLAKTTQGRMQRAREVLAKGLGQFTRPLYDAAGGIAGKLADALQKIDFTHAGAILADKMHEVSKAGGVALSGVGAFVRGVRGGGGGGPGGTATVGAGLRAGIQGRSDSETAGFSGAGRVAVKVGQIGRQIVGGIAPVGKQIVDALKPAMPFLQNVLLPLLIGIGKGVLVSIVGAFKVAVPIIKFVATVLGAVGNAAKPFRGIIEGVGVAIGFLASGPILKALSGLGKVGIVFKLLGAPIRVVTGATKAAFGAIGTLAKVGGKVAAVLSGPLTKGFGLARKGVGLWVGAHVAAVKAIIGVMGPIVGRLAGIAGRAVGAVGRVFRGLLGVASKIVGGVADVFGTIGHKIAGAVRGKLGDLTGFFSRVGKGLVSAIARAIGAAGGAIGNAIESVIPGPIKGAAKKLLGLRSGGRVGYRSGGLVDAMVSPGEALVYPDGSVGMVAGPRVAADSVAATLPVGTAVLTGHGQSLLGAGATLDAALAAQRPHFAAGGIVGGKYVSTAYGPPWGGIQGGGVTATGVNLKRSPHLYGVAVDPKLIPLGSQVYVQPNPFGRSGAFRAFDTGGAIKGRRLDFYDWRGRRSQNAWGRHNVTVSHGYLPGGTGGGASGSGDDTSVHIPINLGASRRRAGLVTDALSQGIAAGAAGLTRSEISRANRGGRGASLNPIIAAIAGAQTATTREVTIKGAGAGGATGKLPSGVTVPSTTWNPSRKPIARWIAPYLTYGASHGWPGVVTSGYRTAAEQAAAAKGFGVGRYGKGGPQGSNHRRTAYPGGAVDVTAAAALSAALAKKPGPHLLQWAGAKDPVHFSHPSGGSYRLGGLVRRFRTGGIAGAGAGLNSALTGARTFKGGTFDRLDEAIGRAAEQRLEALRRGVLAEVRKGGSKKAIQRLQGVLDLIDFEIGRRIGREGDVIAQRTAKGERRQGQADRLLSRLAIDPASTRGLTAQVGLDDEASRTGGLNVKSAQRALTLARRTGNTEAIRNATDQLTGAQDALDEAITKGIEDRRALLVQSAQDVVDAAQKGIDAARRASDQGLRRAGIDASSAAGIGATLGVDQQEVTARSSVVDQLSSKLGGAKDPGARKAISDQLDQARSDLDEAFTVLIEHRRDLVRAQAQEGVDTAQFGVDVAQAALSGLDVQQRLNRTADTPAGMVAKAQAIQAQLIPSLGDSLRAAQAQFDALSSIGDTSGARAAFLAVQQAGTDIAGAMADAADLVRQAATTAAQDAVDSAGHTKNMGDLGLARLELEQRIAGTYDAGGAQRADYIKSTIIPALQAELAALNVQRQTAQDQGDQKLADQIAESIAGKQNDILQATLDATEEVAANTSDKRVGGTLGFTYGNENVTDAIIAAGNGS